MFCKHKWEILSEITTKSKFEHSMEQVPEATKGKLRLPWQLTCADRKHIQTLKCGKLKRFITII